MRIKFTQKRHKAIKTSLNQLPKIITEILFSYYVDIYIYIYLYKINTVSERLSPLNFIKRN